MVFLAHVGIFIGERRKQEFIIKKEPEEVVRRKTGVRVTVVIKTTKNIDNKQQQHELKKLVSIRI